MYSDNIRYADEDGEFLSIDTDIIDEVEKGTTSKEEAGDEVKWSKYRCDTCERLAVVSDGGRVLHLSDGRSAMESPWEATNPARLSCAEHAGFLVPSESLLELLTTVMLEHKVSPFATADMLTKLESMITTPLKPERI